MALHLTPEELIDLAEGTRPESALPHVETCAACRRQIADLRAAMAASIEIDAPEPSPLFWEHLSARVREAVAAEGAPGPRRREWKWGSLLPWSWSTTAVAGVVAAVALAVYMTTPRDRNSVTPSPDLADTTAEVALQPFGAADDPSLVLMADLTEQIDPEAVAEAGWSRHAGAVDEAVANLTDGERLELQRLLREELAKS